MSTKAKAYVDGLTSGTRYWFRVAAVSAAGQGAWSEAVGVWRGTGGDLAQVGSLDQFLLQSASHW